MPKAMWLVEETGVRSCGLWQYLAEGQARVRVESPLGGKRNLIVPSDDVFVNKDMAEKKFRKRREVKVIVKKVFEERGWGEKARLSKERGEVG